MSQHPQRVGLGIVLMVGSALFVCVGQLLWKLGAASGVWFLVVGFIFYGVGAVLMLVAYRFGELSVLQPILGLSYALSLLAGWYWLDERISALRILGVVVVVVGVVLVARGSSRMTDPQMRSVQTGSVQHERGEASRVVRWRLHSPGSPNLHDSPGPHEDPGSRGGEAS